MLIEKKYIGSKMSTHLVKMAGFCYVKKLNHDKTGWNLFYFYVNIVFYKLRIKTVRMILGKKMTNK